MNNTGDGDDEEADDEGSNRDVESIPSQSPRTIIVTMIITVSRLGKKNSL